MSKKSNCEVNRSFTKISCTALKYRVDDATDELAEALADFDLNDKELIEVRDAIKKRISDAQEILLYGETESCG